jgi:hypothetical protein
VQRRCIPQPSHSQGKISESGHAEFQKILDHPGLVENEVIGALARAEVGRAHVMAHETIKAKTAYSDFLALWKAADPDLPILSQARTESAKLP